jgi:hypothetical protein
MPPNVTQSCLLAEFMQMSFKVVCIEWITTQIYEHEASIVFPLEQYTVHVYVDGNMPFTATDSDVSSAVSDSTDTLDSDIQDLGTKLDDIDGNLP